MKIALDIMSGDKPPHSFIKGALRFLNNSITKDLKIILYGTKKEFLKHKKLLIEYDDISYVFCTEVITMEDKPSFAFKNNKQSN